MSPLAQKVPPAVPPSSPPRAQKVPPSAVPPSLLAQKVPPLIVLPSRVPPLSCRCSVASDSPRLSVAFSELRRDFGLCLK